MAEIYPFRGIRYNFERSDDYSSVVTQPYDKISPEDQEKYYKRSDYNIARIIKGKEKSGDNAKNKYRRATEYFDNWQSKGILQRDLEPAIYAYHQEYTVEGELRTRGGFIALVKLEDPGKGVKAHEKTMKGPKADRLNLMRATEANFGHIFMLYSDPERKANKALKKNTTEREPEIQATDDFDNGHKVWTITDQDAIEKVSKALSNKELYIADGHHRYETAVNFMKECRKKGWKAKSAESFENRMMTLINMDEPGLTILPTHRLIHDLDSFDIDEFLEKAGENFYVAAHDQPDEMFLKLDGDFGRLHSFGFYPADSEKYYSLTLKDEGVMDELISGEWSNIWKRLDVSILHNAILDPLLGIGESELEEGTNVSYIRSKEAALQKVKDGHYQMAFIMNPTSVDEVRKVADRGEKMPQKSTDFYPKLLTGLIMTKMDISK